MQELFQQVWSGLQQTTPLEFVAVMAGIASVFFSRKEHILVYPVGLVNTIIFIYLSFKYHLPGEAVVNFYYTVMSIYGWWLWAKKDQQQQPVMHVSFSSRKEWQQQLLFATVCYVALYGFILLMRQWFAKEAIPWADAFASATAFTGMWLMAKKKVESWYWWMATNIASIPLYFVKGLVFTSVQYVVLLLLAVAGWWAWRVKAKNNVPIS